MADEGVSELVEIRVQDYREVHRRSVRRDLQHRHGRARRRGPCCRCTPPTCSRCCGRAADCSTTRSHAGRVVRDRRSPRRPSSTGTSSPTASSSRSRMMIDAIEGAGFEVRDVESLREHYALTLRAWVANLESGLGRSGAADQRARGRGSGGSTWPVRRWPSSQPDRRQPGARRTSPGRAARVACPPPAPHC